MPNDELGVAQAALTLDELPTFAFRTVPNSRPT